MGVVSPGFDLVIIGEDRVLGDGEEGELCVRTDAGGGSQYIFKGAPMLAFQDQRQS